MLLSIFDFSLKFANAGKSLNVFLPAGSEARKQIYSLYHYLNHNNLFGGSYYYQCESILSSLTRGL